MYQLAYIQATMWVLVNNNLTCLLKVFLHLGFETKGTKVSLKNVVAS